MNLTRKLHGVGWGLALALLGAALWLALGARAEAQVVGLEDLESSEPPSLQPHRPATALAVSADGARVAAVRLGGEVQIFELAAGRMIQRWAGSADPAVLLAFDPSGRQLVAVFEEAIHLYDLEARVERRIPLPVEALAAALRPDGRRLAWSSYDGCLRILELPSGRLLRLLRLRPPPGAEESLEESRGTALTMAYRPDGELLLVGSWETLWEVDPEAGRARTFRAHPERLLPIEVRYDRRSRRLLFGGRAAARLGDPPGSFAYGFEAQVFAASPQGESIVVAGRGELRRFGGPGAPPAGLRAPAAVRDVRFSGLAFLPSGDRLVAASEAGLRVLSVRDLSSLSALEISRPELPLLGASARPSSPPPLPLGMRRVRGPAPTLGVARHRGGGLLVFTRAGLQGEDRIERWRLEGASSPSLRRVGALSTTRWEIDEAGVFVGDRPPRLPADVPPVHPDPEAPLDRSPDGSLGVEIEVRELRVRALRVGAVCARYDLREEADPIFRPAFTRDGRRLVILGQDGGALIWDLRQTDCIRMVRLGRVVRPPSTARR